MKSIVITGMLFLVACISPPDHAKEIRVTRDDTKNHDLDNNDNFSPDGKWLVYDTRTETGGIGGCSTIERVNTETGKTEVVYSVPGNSGYGPGAGAASYHPSEDKVIFIHGLPVCTPENPYQQWRRTGMIVSIDRSGKTVRMDSRDVTFPFTPGALRGGTHRHEWSRDGRWIGFTYNDAIMKKLEDSTGIKWNLRTIGVSGRKHRVTVDQDTEHENVQGEWYSVVVVRVVPYPEPGSDEINLAASDSWIGTSGYKKPDGTLQVARAFLGRVINREGKPVDELFVVDIPDSVNVPGEYGPLEGTPYSFPMPPKWTVQRRLTHTAESKFPGCNGIVRSSPDGEYIAFLASDSTGINQVFLVPPQGEDAVQLTQHISGVQSGARWEPNSRSVCYVWDNSIVICEISDRPFEKRFKRLTPRTRDTPTNLVWSNDGKTIAFNRFVASGQGGEQKKQIFIIRL